MAPPPVPPEDPWYGRYWRSYNRPYAGSGCLYTIVVFFFIWWLLALVFPPLAVWRGLIGLPAFISFV